MGRCGGAVTALLIHADRQMAPAVALLAHLPALAGIDIEWLDPASLAAAPDDWAGLPAVHDAVVLWDQVMEAGTLSHVGLRRRLPPQTRIIRFPRLRCTALWPTGEGAAAVAARLAADPAAAALPDEALFARHLAETEATLPDPRLAMAADVLRWLEDDARCDVKLADAMAERFLVERLFHLPDVPAGALLGHLLDALLALTFGPAPDVAAAVRADLAWALQGFAGDDTTSWPVHPGVATRLGLSWNAGGWNAGGWREGGHAGDFRAWVLRRARGEASVGEPA